MSTCGLSVNGLTRMHCTSVVNGQKRLIANKKLHRFLNLKHVGTERIRSRSVDRRGAVLRLPAEYQPALDMSKANAHDRPSKGVYLRLSLMQDENNLRPSRSLRTFAVSCWGRLAVLHPEAVARLKSRW